LLAYYCYHSCINGGGVFHKIYFFPGDTRLLSSTSQLEQKSRELIDANAKAAQATEERRGGMPAYLFFEMLYNKPYFFPIPFAAGWCSCNARARVEDLEKTLSEVQSRSAEAARRATAALDEANARVADVEAKQQADGAAAAVRAWPPLLARSVSIVVTQQREHFHHHLRRSPPLLLRPTTGSTGGMASEAGRGNARAGGPYAL